MFDPTKLFNEENKNPDKNTTTPDVEQNTDNGGDTIDNDAIVSGVENENDTTSNSENVDMSIYHRRRLIFAAAVIAAVLGIGWVSINGVPGAAPSLEESMAVDNQARDASWDEFNALTATDIASALAWYEDNGSYDGFTLTEDAKVAAAGDTALISRTNEGACYIYAVIGNQPSDVQQDPTGAGCTQSEIDSAQTELNQEAEELYEARMNAESEIFNNAASEVSFYASMNFTNGQPSLMGLPNQLADGVYVLVNNGNSVILARDHARGCTSAVVDIYGNVTDIQQC